MRIPAQYWLFAVGIKWFLPAAIAQLQINMTMVRDKASMLSGHCVLFLEKNL